MALDTKQYILSIQAQLKGDKVVLTGLKQIDGAIKEFTQTVKVGGDKSQNFGDIIEKAGKRALIVAPMWLLLRSAMMATIQTIQKIIEDNMKFEDSMSDVQTMLEGTSQEIEVQMIAIKRTILDTSSNSRVSLGDLTDAFRFLKSANLDFQQTMAGFPVVASLMNAFGLSAMEASRAVAGMANTAEASLGTNLTLSEKMAKIGDILAFTYVKQDVLIGELIQSYAKFAPVISFTDNSFLEIITTLGLLNTLMNRGSRAGTEMQRGIIELATKSAQLANIFSITYDPTKPINFINIISQINNKIGQTGKISGEQADALSKTFGNIGLKAFGLLIANFDKLQLAIADAEKNTVGYLKRIEEIRMGTTVAQLQRMSNLLSVLGNDFISGVFGVGDFAQALKLLNDTIEFLRPAFTGMGEGVGKVGKQMGESLAGWSFLLEGRFDILIKQGRMLRGVLAPLVGFFPALAPAIMSLPTPAEPTRAEETKKALEQEEERKKLILSGKLRIDPLKEEKELITHNINLLKIFGANEVDIAKFRLQSLETLKQYMKVEDYVLERQKIENDLIEAQVKLRREIVNTYQKASISLLQTLGASESQILTIKMKQLELNRSFIGDAQFLIKMEDLRLQRVIAIAQEKEKERQTQAGLAVQFAQASETERVSLRRMLELRQLSAPELAKQFTENAFDEKIILQFWSNFSSEGQKAVGDVLSEKFGLPTPPIGGLEEVPKDLASQLLGVDRVTSFWSDWTDKARIAVADFAKSFDNVARTGGFGGSLNTPELVQAQKDFVIPNLSFGTNIAHIEINLPDNALERVAEEAGKEITNQLSSNEELGKKIAKLIRPYL